MRKLLLFLFVLIATQLSAAVVVEEILARVGNEIITKSEYELEEKRLYDQMKRNLQGQELETQYQNQRKNLLDFLINQKLLEQRARELDLNVDEEINAAVLRLREENNIPDDAALEQALTAEGSSMAQLRDDFRRRIIQQRILWNYVQGKVNISEDEIKNYYEQHKSQLTNPAVTKIRRYTITGEGIEKGVLNAEARSLLNVLRNKMEIVPANFPNMKADESVEVSATELDPKIAKLLDETKVGEYTELVDVPSGWAIFLVENRTEAKPISFDEARGQIYNVLLQERAQKYQKSFLEDLRKQNFVVINRPVQEN
jgi:peptidyl-prolyl cis-trans isomerase SurA